jgi:hypothetical protein
MTISPAVLILPTSELVSANHNAHRGPPLSKWIAGIREGLFGQIFGRRNAADLCCRRFW